MKTILKYKYFRSSEEFEKWQEDNTITMCQIMPVSFGIKGNEEDINTLFRKSEFNYEVGIMVTYYEGIIDGKYSI